MKNTKIVCTLGPASEDLPVIKKMIKAGMNCVRLNFSHGSYENFHKIITNVQKASKELNIPVALIQDLQGPKIRIGEVPKEGITIKKGQKIVLTTSPLQATSYKLQANYIPIQYQKLPQDVKKGDTVLVDDGLIELEVLSTDKRKKITCLVKNDGIIKSHKGINVPGGNISAPPLTEKDYEDLKFGLKYNMDYIALSFVKDGNDIIELQKFLRKHHSHALIIAKIERREAVDNLKNIINESDALMVARGDLGLEIDAEKVPIVQKEIARLGNIYGKPTIIATQMMQSMVTNPRPTRAEISDAATAVFDKADALMLSNETSVGLYPVQAVQYINKVCNAAEQELKAHGNILQNQISKGELPLINATCLNACEIAQDILAKYIVVLTEKGYTARLVGKHHTYIPILTFTNNQKIINQLSLIWGINNIYYLPKYISPTKNEDEIIACLKENKLVKKNDEIVIVSVCKARHLISTIKI